MSLSKQQLREKIDDFKERLVLGVVMKYTGGLPKDTKLQHPSQAIFPDKANDILEHLIDEWTAGVIPEKIMVQDDDDIEHEFTGKRLALELQENNINYGYNIAIDDTRRRAGIGGDRDG